MQQISTVIAGRGGMSEGYTLGLDLGDRTTHFCLVDVLGQVIERGSAPTTREGLRERFEALPRSRVVVEVSTHSPWTTALFKELGHEVIVANPRAVKAISHNARKRWDEKAGLLDNGMHDGAAKWLRARSPGVEGDRLCSRLTP